MRAKSGIERARLLAESAGIDSHGSLLDAVAERLSILLSELDSISDEQLEGIEPAIAFSAVSESDGA